MGDRPREAVREACAEAAEEDQCYIHGGGFAMSDFARLSVAEVADALREAPADELPELRATLAAAAVDESVPLTSRDFALMVVEAIDRMSTGVDPADVFRTLEAAYRLKGTPGEGVTSIQERLDPLPRTGRQG